MNATREQDWLLVTDVDDTLVVRRARVITSYSIHYTKLYELGGNFTRDNSLSCQVGYNRFAVITSYSIHYTKLYEGAKSERPSEHNKHRSHFRSHQSYNFV